VWKYQTTRAEAERTVLCKHLDGKALFTGMLHLYAAIYQEMNETFQLQQVESPKEFCERNPSDEQANVPNKMEVMSGSVHDPRIQPQAALPTRNFFAP
jgi:hypothetical protein